MSTYALADFGGRFLTTPPEQHRGRTLAGVTAYVEWFKPVNAKDVVDYSCLDRARKELGRVK